MLLATDRIILERYEFAVSISRKGEGEVGSVKMDIDKKLRYDKVFHPRLLQVLVEAIKEMEEKFDSNNNM